MQSCNRTRKYALRIEVVKILIDDNRVDLTLVILQNTLPGITKILLDKLQNNARISHYISVIDKISDETRELWIKHLLYYWWLTRELLREHAVVDLMKLVSM